jgi:esterase/lipase
MHRVSQSFFRKKGTVKISYIKGDRKGRSLQKTIILVGATLAVALDARGFLQQRKKWKNSAKLCVSSAYLCVGKKLTFATNNLIFTMKKALKYTAYGLLALVGILTITYFMGPKLPPPTFPTAQYNFRNASSLEALEADINTSERQVPNIKPNCEARIIWADSTKKQKTKVVLLYLHGFSATYAEGAPVNFDLAKRFGCNIYMARLYEHGVEKGDDNLLNFNADKYVESAEQALHIARQLGDSVVILGTSAGGALAIWLAAQHPDLKGVMAYSPAVEVYRADAKLMAGPWGMQIAHLSTGKNHNDWTFTNPKQRFFWTNHQRFEGIAQLILFQNYAMTPETFSKVNCPFFLGYYYENEEKQDKVVSIPAMKSMFEQIKTPLSKKRSVNFPNTHNHVLMCDLISDDWQTVEAESVKFMTEILGMQPL